MKLSLADVARRAGTSAATLSRYENGWTRFETYTLGKLASALDCELIIELKPKSTRGGPRNTSRSMAVDRLKRLFWDHRLDPADFDRYPVWIAERVLDYGNLDDVRALRDVMGRKKFLRTAALARRLSPRALNFWRQLLEMEGVKCTKKFSRTTAWNS